MLGVGNDWKFSVRLIKECRNKGDTRKVEFQWWMDIIFWRLELSHKGTCSPQGPFFLGDVLHKKHTIIPCKAQTQLTSHTIICCPSTVSQ